MELQPLGGKIEISSKGKAFQDFYGEGSKWIWCFVNWRSHREGLGTCAVFTTF